MVITRNQLEQESLCRNNLIDKELIDCPSDQGVEPESDEKIQKKYKGKNKR